MLIRTIQFLLLILACTGACFGPAFAQDTSVSYATEDLNFVVKGNTLYGKLITPKVYTDKLPVIVFVHGSGPEDYSSSDNYRYLWEAFTRIGFACYSWDRPGVGQSQGTWYTASVADRADEVIAAVNQLKTLTTVDSNSIGFWGISQAGWVIPLAAKKSLPAFIITVSSPVTTAFEQELYRVKSEMKAAGFTKEDIGKAVAYNQKLRKMILTAEPYEAFAKLQQDIKGQPWTDNVISGEKIVYDYLSIVFKKDEVPDLSVLSCPVLAIWGENDLVVPPGKSAATYEQQMKAIGNTHTVIKIIPKADHTLSLNLSGKRDETITRRAQYKNDPAAVFAPGYVSLMTEWLKQVKAQ